MLRKLISILGILALASAYLPSALAGLSESQLPGCCNGIECPMHHMIEGHILCGATDGPGTAFQCCPDVAPRFTSAIALARIAPLIFFGERVFSRSVTSAAAESLKLELGTDVPPPRRSLA